MQRKRGELVPIDQALANLPGPGRELGEHLYGFELK